MHLMKKVTKVDINALRKGYMKEKKQMKLACIKKAFQK